MKQDNKKVAIVILNWNGIHYLKQFLPVLIENTKYPNIGYYLIDNDSRDGSVAFLHSDYKQIEVIQLDANYGFSEGYNRGLQRIIADYYLLLNSDMEVTKNWLFPLVDILEDNEDIAVCMPKILSLRNRDYFEYAGAAGGFIDKYGYPFCRGRILATIEKDRHQYDDLIDVFWASGACMLIKSNLYNQYGGLDNDFFAHMEEIDLCWRLKNLGHRIVCNPKSVVYHVGGGTLPNDNPQKLYLNYRNNLFLLFKNLPSKYFVTIITFRIILDLASAFIYLLRLSFNSFFAVLHAHFSFFSSLKKLNKKRKKQKKLRLYKNHKEVLDKSILYCYFIKKRKYFSQLS